MTGLAGSGHLDRQIKLLGAMAGDPVPVLHAPQRRHVGFTALYPVGAAVVKNAAFGTLIRRRHVAGQPAVLPAAAASFGSGIGTDFIKALV